MDAVATAELIERELRAQADQARAVSEKRYLKSDLVHLGVPVPVIRRVAMRAVSAQRRDVEPVNRSELLELADRLWTTRSVEPPEAQSVHELRMAAIEVLSRWVRLLGPEDLALAERLIRESHGWAYVDAVAVKVVGDLVGRFPELLTVLDRWAADDDFWIRRSALLALLPGVRAKEPDLDRLSRYGDAMLGEKEFFIRKAIGWVLREQSKRDPAWVREWVAERIGSISGVTFREAARHLPATERETLTVAYRSRGVPGPL